MTEKEYESITELMETQNGELANIFIKHDLNGYAKWLSNKIITRMRKNEGEGRLARNGKEFDCIIYPTGRYCRFYDMNSEIYYEIRITVWQLKVSGSRLICKVETKLNGVNELMQNRNYDKAQRRLTSIIKALLIYTIYGKLH